MFLFLDMGDKMWIIDMVGLNRFTRNLFYYIVVEARNASEARLIAKQSLLSCTERCSTCPTTISEFCNQSQKNRNIVLKILDSAYITQLVDDVFEPKHYVDSTV